MNSSVVCRRHEFHRGVFVNNKKYFKSLKGHIVKKKYFFLCMGNFEWRMKESETRFSIRLTVIEIQLEPGAIVWPIYIDSATL